MKKRDLTGALVSSRWKKIAASTNSSIIAILRQENDILKFLREPAWDAWSEMEFGEADGSVISIHCFIKGNSPLIYRNYFETKDKYGRFVTSTKVYKMKVGDEGDNIAMMTSTDYEWTDLKAASIRSVMDLATSTVIRYVESMLQVRVLSIWVDYVIDAKSQLWMLWTSEAKALVKAVVSKSRSSSPNLLPRGSPDEERVSASTQVDAALSMVNDLRADSSSLRERSRHTESSAESAGFKMVTLSESIKPDVGAGIKCRGDFCNISLESVGSLASQEDLSLGAMEKFFSEEERQLLRRYDKYKQLVDTSQLSFDYDFIPMRTILRVRDDRRKQKHGDVGQPSWKEFPVSPRTESRVFSLLHAGDKPAEKSKEEEEMVSHLLRKNILETPHQDKLRLLRGEREHRDSFKAGMLSYYDSVRVCPKCYKVYLLLDWARGVLDKEKSGKKRTKRSTESDSLLLPGVTSNSVEKMNQDLTMRIKGVKNNRKRATWRSYASMEVQQSRTKHFLELDNYLRGKVSGQVQEDDNVRKDEIKGVGQHENLYKARVVMAFNDIERAEIAAEILRDAHFDVHFCRDGRELLNHVIEETESRSRRIDCVVVEKNLSLVDAFEVTKGIRGFEKSLRQKESAELSSGGIGQPPEGSRIPIICCSEDTSPSALRSFMKSDMDGCLSHPIDSLALLNTVKAAIPHHLSLLKRNSSVKQRVYRVGPMGIKDGGNDSSAAAYKGLSTSKSKEDDMAYNGIAQLDADTLLPFIVMDASRNTQVQIKNRGAVFNLIICHDLFDTAERLKIFLTPIVSKYTGVQVLLWNYPGQAFTEWRSEQLLNNEYHAVCLNELLGQIGHLGTSDFDTLHPFYILGYGHGVSVATFYAAHYNVPNLRGIISINGWSFLDSYIAGVMHDSINIFECAPPSRPDLPVYFFSRFLFSKDYLTKASVPLALNIYTAVHNPISIKGRVSLCKGVLQMRDTRHVLSEIDRPIICIQSTQDGFVRPLHTEPFVSSRGGEVNSIYHALQEPTKTCIVWVKAGHEIFQEKRVEILLLIEQILTGYHDSHNVLVPRVEAVDSLDNVDPDAHRAIVNKEILGSSVEDRFIANFLKNMNKITAAEERDKGTLSTLQKSFKQVQSDQIRPHLSDVVATTSHSVAHPSPPPQSGSHTSRHLKMTTITDPNAWLDYSRKMTEIQAFTGQEGKTKFSMLPEGEQLLVLDPTSILFDKQDPTKRSRDQILLTHKSHAAEFPEVKEYMTWRLKRNKRRLQRLQNAARIIQSAFRCYLARYRVSFIRRSRAALNIQRYFRGWMGRCVFIERARLLWAVQMVQMYWRGYSARKKHWYIRLEITAAVSIQKTFRGLLGRIRVKAIKKTQCRAACVIQALYRRMRARSDVFRMRLNKYMAIRIQRVYRGRLGRKKATAELDKYIFSRSQTQGIDFGRQMLLEHKLHATKLQSDVALLAQEKVAAEELVERLLEEISGFEEGVRVLEKDMHRLSKVETDSLVFMDDESKYELREQKIRLDKEFGSMLAKISSRKDTLSNLEKKLATIDKFRTKKEEELRTLERKLVVLLEEQQNELNAIKRKQDIRGNMLAASHEELSNAQVIGGGSPDASALVIGSKNARSGPSIQEKRQAAQLMQSTETLMKFGFMSMSMTYFSSLNMIKALRTVSAQDTVMAALSDVHAQKAVAFGTESVVVGPTGLGGVGGGGKFVPDLKRGQFPGQEALRVSAWSVEDVSKWLDTLSLGQYKETFIDAAIDGEFLYDLDEEDLKNTLGIEHRLHRKKILTCVQRLKVAEAQTDSKLDALLRETNSIEAPVVNFLSVHEIF